MASKDNYVKNKVNKAKAVVYQKEDLAQVNPQLHKSLAIINAKSSKDIISDSSEKSNTKNEEDHSRVLDEEYLSAVESGDMEKAQRMVDEAAKAAGYISEQEFRMDHRAPNAKDDICITEADRAYGGDGSLFSPYGAQYYGDGRSYFDSL